MCLQTSATEAGTQFGMYQISGNVKSILNYFILRRFVFLKNKIGKIIPLLSMGIKYFDHVVKSKSK